MPAAEARDSAPAVIPRRDRVLITSCILLICAIAWAYLVHVEIRMSSVRAPATMAGMALTMDAPWRAAELVLTFTMWSAMMVGMMAPTVLPVLLLFAASHARRADGDGQIVVVLFGLGYVAVWLGFSACATFAQWALNQAALLSPTMALTSPRLAGVLLVVAGAYQLTPAKRACLKHCQTPMAFLMSHWRAGRGGAFRMGLEHGLYCLGCCWAVMAVLFAVGVMNLAWVGLLTVFILIERLGQSGALVARVGGAAMVGLGVALITG